MPWAIGDPTLDALNPLTGSGSPEGVVTGERGQFYFDTVGSVLYIMVESDPGTTGWRIVDDSHTHVETDVTDLSHYDSADFTTDHGTASHPYAATVHTHIESEVTDLDHYTTSDFGTDHLAADHDGKDTEAIHDNVSGEINAIAAKTTPASNDVFVIEDSAASYAKKKATLDNLRLTGKRLTSGDSPYSALATDSVLLCDTSSGAITVNLPTAASADGHSLVIKQIAGASAVTVSRSGADQIDTDGSSVTSKALNSIGAQWAGTGLSVTSKWYTIGEHGTIA